MASSVSALTGEQILKLRAVDLFREEDTAKSKYLWLVRRWHPDAGGDSAVFAHISKLYSEAKQAWVDGTYPNTLTIRRKSGDVLHYPYIAVRKFELGELYVCERHVIWATERKYDDLAKRWLDTVKSYKFPNEQEEKRTVPFIPRNSHTVANGDRAYTIVNRPADYIRVADILQKMGAFDPRHVCWIMSRAYQIAGFMGYVGIKHIDFSPETFFIEPATHFGALLGGWFYAAPPGKKPIAAPDRTLHLAKSPAMLDAQIRMMGRRLLGINVPSELKARKDVNEHVRKFLLGNALERPGQAQRAWREALKDAFGKRTFTELPLTTAEIYSA